MPVQPINTDRAEALYRALGNWRLVGLRLAFEEGRPICYQADSIKAAVYRAHRQVYTTDLLDPTSHPD
jgi:hypothetical protein